MIGVWKKLGATRLIVLVVCASFLVVAGYMATVYLSLGKVTYSEPPSPILPSEAPTPSPTPFVVTHISTPLSLKAVYYTSWAAGSPKFRKELFDIIDTTEINAVVIDVKDYSGRVSFLVEDPILKEYGSEENRIPDVKEFIGELHDRGIYVIARISAFQDSFLIKGHPEWAVKTKAGNVWKDFRGVKWLDPGAEPVWDYLAMIGRESYAVGFDELNFDYIRFPSDGNLSDIYYPWSDGKKRTDVMKSYFTYIHDQFADTSIPLSVDLFGLTTSATGDLGIGQVLEDTLPYFDYIYPMVYPSHFGYGFNGYDKPAKYPYEVVKFSMDRAVEKSLNATSTPTKIRPWLQAFDLGATYSPPMVRAQIQATYDAGLTGWLLWNAGSVYDKEAMAPKDNPAAISVATTTVKMGEY